MVSFSCACCGDVVKKPKIMSHYQQCGGQQYSCVDCMESFDLETIKAHTSCVTETEKYQGKWQQKQKQQPQNNKKGGQQQQQQQQSKGPVRPQMPIPDKPLAECVERKRQRTTTAAVDFSDSDGDEGVLVQKKSKAEKPVKKASPKLSPRPSPKPSPKLTPNAKVEDAKKPPKVQLAAAGEAAFVLPEIPLGSLPEVADVAVSILGESSSMAVKDFVKALVFGAYERRVVKHLSKSIGSLVAEGKLQGVESADGGKTVVLKK